MLILLSIIYSSMYAGQQLSNQLDQRLIGKNLLVKGFVSSIPVKNGSSQRFEFKVVSHQIVGAQDLPSISKKFPEKIRLSWYYGQRLVIGETWQLEVRLKPPHGFMNPGGFDYEAWLFQRGIRATGYVRKSTLNLPADKKLSQMSFTASMMQPIENFRQSLALKIDAIAVNNMQHGDDDFNFLALIKALAIGDKSSISNAQWRVLIDTGTSHLMAISGLHIGLAAFFAYMVIRRLIPAFIMKKMPAQHIALIGSMSSALLYAMVAGLSLPTQRAIIMLMVLSVMVLIRRNHRPIDALGLALFVVLLIDPLAVLSVGFWFSFSAVAVIFLSVYSYEHNKNNMLRNVWINNIIIIVKQWIRLQLLITLFLLPMSLLMFQQASLVSPIANLFLIPYVSFLVVPVVLLAILCLLISPALSTLLFEFSAVLLEVVWPLLRYLSALPNAVLVKGDIGVFQVLIITMALLLIYFSKHITKLMVANDKSSRYRVTHYLLICAICLMIFPVLLSNRSVLSLAEYKLTLLDVGQGSSAVIQTKNHVMVFDTGAKFSDKFDAGTSVVIPYLRSQGIQSLHYLVVSHGDADHIGGAQVILDAFPETTVLGQDIEALQTNKKQLCLQGQKWHWDGVDFEILSPLANVSSAGRKQKRNNHSCVLRVSSAAGSVLFTGDIEASAERVLLSSHTGKLASDILIVPHHGSKTSSSDRFIKAVNPALALLSVGYKNKYRLPNNKILARYLSKKITVMRTDKNGAVTVMFALNKPFVAESYRLSDKKYWHHVVK
ncbi:MAG: DNA internalization-related competence protein ComEC/Rec2 [Gammaproteobacteria bacterium]|nr:DNA internalization-related competence protein ComEC/Rec2 [Gammaproteobacteria bacterium]